MGELSIELVASLPAGEDVPALHPNSKASASENIS